MASAFLVPCTRTTAASPPGCCTVSFITLLSYCSHIQRREAMSGAARIFSSDASTGLRLVVGRRAVQPARAA